VDPDRRRARAADAVDPAEDIRLGELRGRATDLVPTSGVDDEHAAVRILQHVGRAEVGLVRGEEVRVPGAEGRAVGDQLVADDLAGIEVADEQVALEARPERVAAQGG